jgi:hypothetical protein
MPPTVRTEKVTNSRRHQRLNQSPTHDSVYRNEEEGEDCGDHQNDSQDPRLQLPVRSQGNGEECDDPPNEDQRPLGVREEANPKQWNNGGWDS